MTGKGRFGKYGGQYVPETLMNALIELEDAYVKATHDPAFGRELAAYQSEYAGRPTPLTFCENMSRDLGFKVYLKREDLVHGGSHKLNNTLGQALLAKRMGKKRLIAETGAGQHGVATAIAGAALGFKVEVFMGEVDTKRQALNVFRMELMGATVHPVTCGTKTLKDATNEALRDWVAHVNDTHYLIGSVVGPHPFPTIVRDFQSVIGREAREQIQRKEKKMPDAIVACVGGGSNAIGIFHPFLADDVELIGVEAAGKGVETGEHSATLCAGIRACCTARSRTCCRTTTVRCSPRTVLRPASITRASAPSMRCSKTRTGFPTKRFRTRTCSTRSGISQGRKGSSRRLSLPTQSHTS